MMTEALVSILIPVFNRRDLLAETLDSALAQTYPNIEVVVVDNCSTDGTWKILEEYAKRDYRVRIFRNEENLGPVRNWKRCLDYANGIYAKFLWSDDLIKQDFLEKTVPFLENPEIGFVFTGTIVFDVTTGSKNSIFKLGSTGVYPIEQYFSGVLLSYEYPVSPGCALFRLIDLKKNLMIDIPNKINADFSKIAIGNDLLLFLLTANEYPYFAFISDILSFFRSHPDSISYINKRYNIDLYYNITKAYYIYIYRADLIPKLNVLLWAFLIRNITYKNKLIKSVKDFYPYASYSKICWPFFLKKLINKFRPQHT